MLRALACAILFLTRIPLPRLALDNRDFARSCGLFAWVGLLLSGALALGSTLLPGWLGVRLTALVLVAGWVLVTGGLHLDGLADTVDGLSGGRGQRERTLEIMRDSRIGSHGALALVLVLLGKWAALERALELDLESWWLAPVLARYLCTGLVVGFPYARAEGLGSPFAMASRPAALSLGALALLAGGLWLGPSALLPGTLGALTVLLWAWRTSRRLHGLTGDVYGASIELAELAALLWAPALR